MQRISIQTMKRIVSLVLAFVFSAFLMSQAHAQSLGAPDFMRGKFVVGGSFGGGLYGNRLYLGLAPQIGFRITRSLEIGARLGYELNHYFGTPYYGSYSCHYFSGALYANLEVFRGLYLHVEDEESCMLLSGQVVNPNAPKWYNSVFVGVGYRQYVNYGDFVYYSLLYNLSWGFDSAGNYNTPYANPFMIRIGYCHGISYGKEKQQRYQYQEQTR